MFFRYTNFNIEAFKAAYYFILAYLILISFILGKIIFFSIQLFIIIYEAPNPIFISYPHSQN